MTCGIAESARGTPRQNSRRRGFKGERRTPRTGEVNVQVHTHRMYMCQHRRLCTRQLEAQVQPAMHERHARSHVRMKLQLFPSQRGEGMRPARLVDGQCNAAPAAAGTRPTSSTMRPLPTRKTRRHRARRGRCRSKPRHHSVRATCRTSSVAVADAAPETGASNVAAAEAAPESGASSVAAADAAPETGA